MIGPAEFPPSLTTADLIAWTESALAPVTDSARLEAELLLADSTGAGRAEVIANPQAKLRPLQARRLKASVARRGRGEPLAYVLGAKEFYSLSLRIGPAVLVPRPETETLVDAALERLPASRSRVLDLGTGSGAIALALKHARPDSDVTGVDCDLDALDVAAINGRHLNLAVRWLRSDWFSAIRGTRFDLIVANPPYVASNDPCFDTALAFEPRVALDGGRDGLDAFRAIMRDASAHLVSRGWLLLEHGFDQRASLVCLAQESGFELASVVDDLAGLPRVACFREASR